MKNFFAILLTFALAVPLPAHATDPDDENEEPVLSSRALVPLKATRAVLVVPHNSLVTRLAVEENTAFLASIFPNGEIRTMRISRIGDAQAAVEYKGWPYMVDKKGRLWAMDLSFRTRLMTKLPILTKRLWKTFPYASASAVTLYGLVWLYNGRASPEAIPAVDTGTALGVGLFGTLAFSAVRTLLRSNFKLQRGGNFFKRLVADDVEGFTPIAGSDDQIVNFRKVRPGSQTRLSDLAPPETMKTKCIYALTKLVNQ